jgi:hypothetical protein
VTGQADPAVRWPGGDVLTLVALAGSPAAAMADPARWLTEAGTRLATARPPA